MKVRKIKFENNTIFGNAEIEFTDDKGSIVDNIILAGENGSGKTKLLNIIYNFSTISTRGEVSDEKRYYYIYLSKDEIDIINKNINEQYKLISPNGEIEIIEDFTSQSGYWNRIKVNYESICDTETTIKKIDSSHFFQSVNVKSLFKSIFSTVEINYDPEEASGVGANEIDVPLNNSVRSSDKLATDIQQLFIDIDTNDAMELKEWIYDNKGIAPPMEIVGRRINRFNNSFSYIFNDLKFKNIQSIDNKKKVIFEKNDKSIDIGSLSSGEKQVIFRGAFLLRYQQSIKGNIILIDEPEISLHPLWQKKILDYYRLLFTEENGVQNSQMFVATHSQYVLESALSNKNTLIIALRNDQGTLKANPIKGPFILPTISSAEINYFVFGIVSNDYHTQLYGFLQQKHELNSIKKCDDYILKSKIFSSTYYKCSNHIVKKKITSYKTLPTFIRNCIHHPNDDVSFTNEELAVSTEFLIELCKE